MEPFVCAPCYAKAFDNVLDPFRKPGEPCPHAFYLFERGREAGIAWVRDNISDVPYPKQVSDETAQEIDAAITAHLEKELAKTRLAVHGVDCFKVNHTRLGEYLHGEDDDTAYTVDGVMYCGRCHFTLA